MGTPVFFDEVVDAGDTRGRSEWKCSVEVVDCYGTPELRIGPEDDPEKDWIAEFKDWDQFTRFVQAVVDLHGRRNGGRTRIAHP